MTAPGEGGERKPEMAALAQNKEVCPICRMEVNPLTTPFSTDFKGRKYYFCADSCRTKFLFDPSGATRRPTRRKGWWGRYLDRLAKANHKEFGRSGPTCCG
jgi:YHS domain-containing protein